MIDSEEYFECAVYGAESGECEGCRYSNGLVCSEAGGHISSTGKIITGYPEDPNSHLRNHPASYIRQIYKIMLTSIVSCENSGNTTHSMKLKFGCTDCSTGPCDITSHVIFNRTYGIRNASLGAFCPYRVAHLEDRYQQIIRESVEV